MPNIARLVSLGAIESNFWVISYLYHINKKFRNPLTIGVVTFGILCPCLFQSFHRVATPNNLMEVIPIHI